MWHRRLSRERVTHAFDRELCLASVGTEERLLANACAAGLSNSEIDLGKLGDIDWNLLIDLARKHRVEPLVAQGLRRSTATLPPNVAAHFRAAVRRNALHALRLTECLVRLSKAFRQAQIPMLPLKGVALAARYYETMAVRHSGDLDIFIESTDTARAHQVLLQLDFVQVSSKSHKAVGPEFVENKNFVHHLSYMGFNGICLELHFRLHQNPRLQMINLVDVLSRGTFVAFGGVRLPVLPNDVQFSFLAAHGSRHEWERLQWVCDIAAMINRASTEEVLGWIERSDREGLSTSATQALIIAHVALGSALPESVSKFYAGSRRAQYMVRRSRRVILGDLPRKMDGENGLDLPLRLYRLSMSPRPSYLWHEVMRAGRAVWRRHCEVTV